MNHFPYDVSYGYCAVDARDHIQYTATTLADMKQWLTTHEPVKYEVVKFERIVNIHSFEG